MQRKWKPKRIALFAAIGILMVGLIGTVALTGGGAIVAAVTAPFRQSPGQVEAQRTSVPSQTAVQPAKTAASQTALPRYDANVQLSRQEAQVGEPILLNGEEFHAGQKVQILWQTVSGHYVIQGLDKFGGVAFEPQSQLLGETTADAAGKVHFSFRVPKDYGGMHDLLVTSKEGGPQGKTGLMVQPKFTVTPASGPAGTRIAIHVDGLGYTDMERNWQVTYDNTFTGLISAVATKGSATAYIRAVGDVGEHTIGIWHNYNGIPYINYQQGPYAYLDCPQFTFRITAGTPIIQNSVETPPPVAPKSSYTLQVPPSAPGVSLHLDRAQATVSEKVTLTGSGFPANTAVSFLWNTARGNRVTTTGYAMEKQHLLEVHTDARGQLQTTFQVPNDLGGPAHLIEAQVNGKTLAATTLQILPKIVSVTPQKGSVGQEVDVHLQGVGWTEYDNIYAVTYDNAYIGYICGFNSHGDVHLKLRLSGQAGPHYIDLYPGIYKGKQPKPDVYTKPMLTYREDHPGEGLPAIRLTVEVTPSP
ncbi:MAG: hypothetical protein IMW91_03320 [Firmicutes bacterium]|nr:hypothetical protein [Bacillota bacterium]